MDKPLISPSVDFAMAGGLSIILAAAVWLLVPENASTYRISWIFAYLCFVVNNPHFIASYILLYWDRRKELGRPRYFAVAAVVPLVLAAYLWYGAASDHHQHLGYAINFMFFTVGWHYIKQVYGCLVVSSARRGTYVTKAESWIFKLNLFSLWAISFVNGNTVYGNRDYYGLTYLTAGLPAGSLTAAYTAVAFTLILAVATFARKWVVTGKLPAPVGLTAVLALYVWYIPALYHPVFWFMIPFFHSFQYLLFVLALKKAEYRSDDRGKYLGQFAGFVALSVIGALLAFKIIPEYLDQSVSYDFKLLGTRLYVAMFLVFINVHHYFIDSVIWRRGNPSLKYLAG